MSDTNMFLEGPYRPQREEMVLRELKVHGEIPKDLNGNLYRVTSSNFFDPIQPEKYHWFNGDGMVHAITLEDGKASIRNKYVESEALAMEKAAGQALWGDLMNGGLAPDMRSGRPPFKNPVNTNAMELYGDVIVFSEGGQPYRLDKDTLETKGTFDFGEIEGPITAHYKVDPDNQDLLFFGYFMDNIAFYHADKNGNMIKQVPFKMDVPSMMHDFAVSENYAIWMTSGAIFDFEGAMAGQPGLIWNPEIESKFAVMHIKTGELTWYNTGETMAVTHYLNAFEKDGVLHVDMNLAPDFGAYSGELRNPFSVAVPCRYSINLKTGHVSGQKMNEVNSEFAKINEELTGREHRYGYYAATETGEFCERWKFDRIGKLDTHTGEMQFRAGPDDLTAPGEVSFIPRAGATSEDDGYLVNVWWDQHRDTSELLIFDAQNLADDPIARVELGQRVPLGFHGSWASLK